jgi:two-component system catabolic regulation response regulator CreB
LARIVLPREMTHKNPRILLVEDDPALGQSLQSLLALIGYDVHWSSTVNEAFNEIAHDGYRAALLDLNLGREHGVTLIASLRASGHHIPPLVILSAQPYEKLREAAKKSGAVAVLQKPSSLEAIRNALQKALEQRDNTVRSG